MSFFDFMTNYAAVRREHKAALDAGKAEVRTPTPLHLRQESAVEISPISLILTEGAGSLIKQDKVSASNKVIAVGKLSINGQMVWRAYLSGLDGGFIQLAPNNNDVDSKTVECRLYLPYFEVKPVAYNNDTNDYTDWAFWLDDKEGYIGAPIMQGKNEDGGKQYNRLWSPTSGRVDPVMTTETITDVAGQVSRPKYRMMPYARFLDDKNTIKEYLLVSVVEVEGIEASVNFWLGLDLPQTDLTVYAA